MATAAQIHANQQNAQKSTGPTSQTGQEASSGNRRTFGLSSTTYSRFIILPDEREEEFFALRSSLFREHAPQTETEKILVRRMAESEWLRARALLVQALCCDGKGQIVDQKEFALYLRYQTTHERSFYRALNELQKLRNQKRKEQIGFDSQKRAAEALNLKKEEFELKKKAFELKSERVTTGNSRNQPAPAPETSPGDVAMAA
jgi:hypothetical protein